MVDEESSCIVNGSSGWKVPMRVENGVHVIGAYVKDLVDTGGPVW